LRFSLNFYGDHGHDGHGGGDRDRGDDAHDLSVSGHDESAQCEAQRLFQQSEYS